MGLVWSPTASSLVYTGIWANVVCPTIAFSIVESRTLVSSTTGSSVVCTGIWSLLQRALDTGF
eukprot:480444-Lingulodinium_polyedra.AAC.1